MFLLIVPKASYCYPKYKTPLREKYKQHFFQMINNSWGTTGKGGNKLRTFSKMKKEFNIEPYAAEPATTSCKMYCFVQTFMPQIRNQNGAIPPT